MDRPPHIIQKTIVLLGAGNAHLRFVKMFGMRPVPGVAVTLVSEAPAIPYSAMVPGHISGDYARGEVTIDLVRLCRASGVRFVAARATGIEAHSRKVTFATRPELSYDALSLGLGSVPALPADLAGLDTSWPMRPMGRLLARLDELEQRLRSGQAFHLAVVGGGASGCELSAAIRKRFAAFGHFRLTLLQGNARLLPEMPARAARLFADALAARGVEVRVDARVTGGDARSLLVNGTERLSCDAALWATQAAPVDLLRAGGLKLDEKGLLLVEDTLQSLTDPAIFGTGDCTTLRSRPELPKNGVYAVREGGVLFDNVIRFLREKPLRPFRPQRRTLVLMNTSDGEAIFTYGFVAFQARWVRWLKERIDRRWVEKFTRFEPMGGPTAEGDEAPLMRCGGCGNKVSGDVLSAVLRRIDGGDDPRVVLGAKAGEDASVHRARAELFGPDPARLVEVQTVDYFKTFLDDPYLFGRIAAISAVSDLYAMNARPFAALAIATLPFARGPVQEAMLYELLTGATQSLRQLGVVLTGGHTTEGPELALGFAVTGHGEEDRLFRKGGLVPGDALILTKPLGSGALLAAWMRGECPAAAFTKLIDAMLVANDRAAAVLDRHGVRACTDVTGFGLAGHLLEMLDASKAAARLVPARVPVYEGLDDVVSRGIVSSLHGDNARAACRVHADAPPPAWLFDPQTAGGLLAGVRGDAAEAVVRELVEAGYPVTAVIGEVVAPDAAGPAIFLA